MIVMVGKNNKPKDTDKPRLVDLSNWCCNPAKRGFVKTRKGKMGFLQDRYRFSLRFILQKLILLFFVQMLTVESRIERGKKRSSSTILFPGVTPNEYNFLEEVIMEADQVASKKTHIPYRYYDLPVCTLKRKHSSKRKNLGSKLQGFNLLPSPYEIKVLESHGCKPVCAVNISPYRNKWLKKLIFRQYRSHFTLDSLPVIMRDDDHDYSVRGYPIGFRPNPTNGGYYLYNHLRFTIKYFENDDKTYHIVGFQVIPVSIQHDLPEDAILEEISGDTPLSTCAGETVLNNAKHYLELEEPTKDGLNIVYSYEVKWESSDQEWTNRWDVYLARSPDDEIHYFAVVNSFMVVLFLTGTIFVMMVRMLRKDIALYNDVESSEEKGWKLVHGDVFRPPVQNQMLLSVAVGTGVQLGVAFLLTLSAASMGMMNPMKKGETLTSIVILYVLSGSVAGFTSSRIYKFCDGKSWKRNTVLTATTFPGLLVGMFLCLNIFLAFAGAATAVSVWTILSIFLLWVCVSTPLAFLGSYFGFRAEKLEVPTKTNQISRFIPYHPWYTRLPYTFFISGVLPFGTISIELLLIMGALWLHQIYHAIGFLVVVLVILTITVAEVSIVMAYLKLNAEDYQWWWSSFLNSSSTGFYLILYSIWFLSMKLNLVGLLPRLIYLTYMSMMSIALSLFCGSVGFISCLYFNRIIYAAVKVD